MTETELLDLFSHEEEVVLTFDTNAIFGHGKNSRFLKLCDDINRLNRMREPKSIRKVISAPVYMEKLHDLRQDLENYDHRKIERFLEEKGIEVLPIVRQHAEHVATILGELYPETKDWHAFKRRQCLSCLGLTHLADEVKGKGKDCGATIDWLVAGHASAEGYVLITNDTDEEFDRVTRKTTFESAVKVVAELLATSGAAS